MAKTLRLLAEQVRRCDLIIEICDARLPLSSRNPEMNKIGGSKPRLLILNKSDLADPERTREWITFYQNEFTEVRAINAQKTNGKMLVSLIGKQTRQIIDQYERKGIRKTVRAMVVGVPNVGKSTLINRVCGEKKGDPRRDPCAWRGTAHADGAEGPDGSLSAPALGRAEAACRHRAGTGAEAGYPVL